MMGSDLIHTLWWQPLSLSVYQVEERADEKMKREKNNSKVYTGEHAIESDPEHKKYNYGIYFK